MTKSYHQVRHFTPATKVFVDSMPPWQRTVFIAWIVEQSCAGLRGTMHCPLFDGTLWVTWQVVGGMPIIDRIENRNFSPIEIVIAE